MEALATSADLADKLSFTMDEGELREATRALEELSDDARYYGSAKWVDVASAPVQVIRLVLKAAARHMKNYEGYITSRAGDETVSFSEKGETPLGDAQFTAAEKKRLNELGGNYRPTLRSVGLYHSTNRLARTRGVDPRALVPTADGDDFPYGDPQDPWA